MKYLLVTMITLSSFNIFAAEAVSVKSCMDRGISYQIGTVKCVNNISYKCTESGWLKGGSCSK